MNELLIGAIDLSPYFAETSQKRLTFRGVPFEISHALILIYGSDSYPTLPAYLFVDDVTEIWGMLMLWSHSYIHGYISHWDCFGVSIDSGGGGSEVFDLMLQRD